MRAQVGHDLGSGRVSPADGGVEPHIIRARAPASSTSPPGPRARRGPAAFRRSRSRPGRRPACQTWHWRPSSASRRSASRIAVTLPPWPLTRSIAGQWREAWRPSSTRRVDKATLPIDSVPGKSACSPLAPIAIAGAEPHPGAPGARPRGDGRRDPRVGVERQMRPVLLKRPDRHHQQPSRSRLDLRPARGAQREPGVPGLGAAPPMHGRARLTHGLGALSGSQLRVPAKAASSWRIASSRSAPRSAAGSSSQCS